MSPILLGGVTIGSALDNIFANFDYSVFSFFGNMQNDVLTWLAKIFTSMGSTVYVLLFAVLGLILCFPRRTRRVGFAIVFAVIIGTVITNVIAKPMVVRIRPYNTWQHDEAYWGWYKAAGMFSESDYSFPSGHTTGAMELGMALLLCHATSKRKGAKAVCWLFPIVSLLVAASRVYLMVHYATDVLAGIIIGLIAGALGFLLSHLICKAFKKRDERADKEGKPVGGVPGIIAIAVAWCVIFVISLTMLLRSGGEDAVRCAYDGDYKCQNEARVDDKKYPAIDGNSYCKVHWIMVNEGAWTPEPETEEPETESKPEKETDAYTPKEPVLNSDLFTFYNDVDKTAFAEDFDTNTPVRALYDRDEQTPVEINNPEEIKKVFEALKGVKVGGLADEMVTDSGLVITFYLLDGSTQSFAFDSPHVLRYYGKYYKVTDNNGVYDLYPYDFGAEDDEEDE